jgi:fused signal recognition particle receptor
MFGFLKNKLKKFFKKESQEIIQEEKEEEIIEETREEIKEKIEELKEETKEEKREEIKEEILEIKKELHEKLEETEEKEKKKGFFSKLKSAFSSFTLSEDKFEELWQELEILLIESNVAIAAIDALKVKLRAELVSKEIKKSNIEEVIRESLKKSVSDLLINPFDFLKKVSEKKPFIIVFFGINGSGKTTSIAKTAYLLKKNKLSCVLAAGDTFRAASIEQLEKHANKLKIPIIKQNYQADSAAVAFDAIAHAKSNDIDVVLIDTAGRMQNQVNLMREMEKIIRVAKPDLKIFVGESITGNDVVEQAKAFNESFGIDGIILSKADVDEKGGAALSVSHITHKPILFLGTGQDYDDLEIFNKEKLLNNIFD